MKNSRKTVIIGLDGVCFDLISNLSETEIMPNTNELISQGTFTRMQSSIPEVSSVAWSSIITGKNPAEHGIFGFTDLFPDSYKLKFPNFNDLKSSPFWNLEEKKSIIINVPSTYPVKEMNGVHISGFVSLELERSVYPKSLIPKLKEMDYRLDVDSEKAHKSTGLFLADLDKTLEARIKTFRYLWGNFEWQIFMLVFTGTDRLMHFLWEAYEDENHKYHRNFLEHFRKIDKTVGEIVEKIKDEDLIIMLSDHGFEKLEKDIYVNYLLREERFLRLKDSTEPRLDGIDYSTKAFALDPARIYINLKGKYPCGGVNVQDKEKILSDLEALFGSLQVDNRKVVKSIYRKDQIYSGPFLEQGPDLILVGNQGFNLKANIKADRLIDKAIFTGKHTQRDAFLIVNRKINSDIISAEFSVFDFVNIMNELKEL